MSLRVPGEGAERGAPCSAVAHAGSLMLVHVAFAVGVRVAAAPFRHVAHALVEVRQGHRVLLVDVSLHVRLQQWALVIGEGHGEKGLRVAHELVDVSLSRHLLHDPLLVVISERAAEFVIVHSWPVLLNAPTPGHLFRLNQFKFHASSSPGNEMRI